MFQSTQSSYVQKDVPATSAPIMIPKKGSDHYLGNLLSHIGQSMAEFDLRSGYRAVGNFCCRREVKYVNKGRSSAELLIAYREVRDFSKITPEKSNFFKNATADQINNVLYAMIQPQPKPCCTCCNDKDTAKCIAGCAFPCILPCILTSIICSKYGAKPIEIDSLEKAKRLIGVFKGLDEVIEQAPKIIGCCFSTRMMHADKETLRIITGFLILSEVEKLLTSKLTVVSDLSATMLALSDLKGFSESLDLKFKVEKMEVEREQIMKKTPEYDKEFMIVNQNYGDFLVSSRICIDQITNDLLDMLFKNSDKTCVKHSQNFVKDMIIHKDHAKISFAIRENLKNLGKCDKIYPKELEPVLEILKERLKYSQLSLRVKTVDSIMEKKDSELQKGIQDLFAMRLFIGSDDTFLTFSAATIACELILNLSNVRNVLVSHKLKGSTGWLDFKILIQFNVVGYPTAEIQIVPTSNFIVDEAVGGHSRHKKSS